MRAAILREYDTTPELGDFDDPAPRGDQVVGEVLAAGLNPVDLRIAGGNFPRDPREPPYVAGKEGVGTLPDGARVYFDETVAPLCHNSPRERLHRCSSPVARVRASASALVHASVSTSPEAQSCITQGTSPRSS